MANKFAIWIHRFVESGAILSLLGMVTVVLLQVVTRFSPGLSAPPWTEEVSRLFFVYAIAFGVGVAMTNDDFPKLDLISTWLSPRWRTMLRKVVFGLIGILTLPLCYFGFRFATNGANETSPSVGFSMSVPFFSMCLLFGLAAVYSIAKVLATETGESPQ